ncbi:MAG: metal ABC transporter permease [Spirochaetaceae bacterium]|nr:metal ABC transporter permease [Spirochaetaceae bacterium]
MIHSILEYTFLQHAILAILFSSIVCGIIGVIVIEKKLILMSGGIAHTAYGGVGLGYFLGINPMISAIVFSVLAALGIGTVQKKGGKQSDIIIAMFWSLGMALGIVFIALAPGYPPNIDSYLFGNILAVSDTNLVAMFLLTLVILAIIIPFYNIWKVFLFDSEFATLIGLNTKLLEYTLFVLIALSVMVLMGTFGIIMLIAMLCAPSATAALLSDNFKKRMIYSTLIGCTISLIGLYISYTFNIATSATIVIAAILNYIIVYLIKGKLQKSLVKKTI